jgi:cobalt-zinc-cadmium efflux system outer membrane protein
MQRIRRLSLWPLALAAGWAMTYSAWAQPLQNSPTQHPPLSLKAVFEEAWELQPEARSIALRRDAANAASLAAASWTADPVAIELQVKTDRPGANKGSREYEVGLAVPLWLPGERARKGALGEAERKAVESKLATAQLRLAAVVREAWWSYQRSHGELGLAQDRLAKSRQLAADVARRFKAGDLSRADQHQVDSEVAQAEAAVAEALGVRDATLSALRGLAGGMSLAHGMEDGSAEPMARDMPTAVLSDEHPLLVDLFDQARVVRSAAELAAVQTRANPELTLATTHGREQSGAPYQQTLTLGVRIPFGAGPRAQAKEALARADALDAEVRANAERARLVAEADAASARVKATQAQLHFMARNAALMRETRAFYEKSFRLGETALPARLLIELEAAQAERQLARTRIDAAAAVSALRQALGLLPQ